MRLVVKPHKPDEKRHIFTEGINYFETWKESIWGAGDKDTLELLEKTDISGKWLNLTAGDGRYNLNLLKKADFVVAADIDECALSKLRQITPSEYKLKLQTRVFDIAQKFPLQDASFDGILCTGALHLFPRKIIEKIIREMNRILKPNGKVILDFAADIKRALPGGKLYSRKNEPKYTLADAEKILAKLFKNYALRIYKSEVPEEIVRTGKMTYQFSCKFLLMVAEKK